MVESSRDNPAVAGRRIRSGVDQLVWYLKLEQSIFTPIESYQLISEPSVQSVNHSAATALSTAVIELTWTNFETSN